MTWPIFTAEWWRSTGATRSMVIVTAVTTALLTSGIGMLTSSIQSSWQRTNDHRAKQVSELVDTMVQFQTFASAFSTEMFVDGTVTTDTRSRLLGNLNDQYARLSALEETIPQIEDKVARSYLDALVATSEAVNSVQSVDTMKEFWSRVSDLTVIRKDFTPQLEKLI